MEDILKRIETWENLYAKVVDRTTPAYLDLLNSMRNDYEINNDTNKCLQICKEIEELITIKKIDCENAGDYLLAMYDTKARLGDFRAYCIALEWNRPIEKQFFLPRRRILEKHGLIQAMQDVADDKLDFLFVSMSPRVGKNLSNSTPILTKNGWTTHGELKVGDYVLNDKGRFVKVLATSPEYPCNCRVTFANGEQIDCHENHEWVVIDKYFCEKKILETKEILKQGVDRFIVLPRIKLPFDDDNRPDPYNLFIKNIEYIENYEMGKCIQVEGGVYLAGRTLIPTHNSTLGLFFLTFMAGQYPERSILGSGHSAAIIQSFYNEILNVITSEEYRFRDIFYNTKIVNKSAEYSWIDLNTNKRFHTFSFRSIETGGTGLVEASNILYCDDLIKDVETANNPDRLDKLFYTYTSTIQDRTIMRLCKDGQYRRCPEIHIATRWSLNDVIGRLIAIYGEIDSDRIKIINIPCYDENGESNFQYDYGKGFSTDYYKKLEMAEDPVVFAAKYLGQPIEREGRPFTKDQLTFYQSLPEEEPDQIVAYADVAHGGEDYFSMPIAYVYGYDVYIEDVLFVNKLGDSDTRPLVCQKLIDNKVTKAGFEENNGGKLYADFIIEDLRKKAFRCNITTHKVPTSKSKLDRILSCQSEIRGVLTDFGNYRIYFKSEELVKDNKQYTDFMQCIYKWSQKPGSIQKTQHDDAPDSLAGLITNVLDSYKRVAKASSKFSISKLGL